MEAKIFDTVSILNKLYQTSDKCKTECFAYCNTILYVGTNDGFIQRYSVNKSFILQNKINYESILIDFKPITNQRKPILKIEVHENAQKLIYLTENILTTINLYDLEPSDADNLKIRNANYFCCNINDSKKVDFRLYVSTKDDQIQIYAQKNKDQYSLKDEIRLEEACIHMDCNKNYLCVGCRTHYLLVNSGNLQMQKIMSYDFSFNPYLCPYLEEGFFLSFPENKGKIVTFTGQVKAHTIEWNEKCTQFQIYYPYLICLSNDGVKIFNIVTTNIIQNIYMNFSQSGEKLQYCQYDNILLLSSGSNIFDLCIASLETQIENLIKCNRIKECLALLAQNSNTPVSNQTRLRDLQKCIAYVELFENHNFQSAKKLFLETETDYKEIAMFIPNITKDQKTFMENNTFLRFVSAVKIKNTIETKLLQIKDFALDYMIECKSQKTEDYVQILFKLTIEQRPLLLNTTQFYNELPLSIVMDCVPTLQENKFYHAVAITNTILNKPEVALSIWQELINGKISDIYFPGVDYVIEYLSKLQDTKLVWEYVPWIMNINQEKAVKIFTERPLGELVNERMRPDIIVDYLKNFKVALIAYLEYLVFIKQIQKEKYHTYLAQIYMDDIIDHIKSSGDCSKSENSKVDSIKYKLRDLLKHSSVYRIHPLIEKLHGYEEYFQRELSSLLSKLGEHDKALDIIVNKLNDFDGAIDYCINVSQNSKQLRKNLFTKLLLVYIKKSNENVDSSNNILKLLQNNKFTEYDLSKVLEVLPINWSLNKIGNFIQENLVKLYTLRSITMMRKSMHNYNSLHIKQELLYMKVKNVVLNEQSQCAICKETFQDHNFRIESNHITHIDCL